MIIHTRLRQLIAQRSIIRSLIVKNLREKYVGSALGIFWAIINPLVIMCAVNFVFAHIMPSTLRHFPLFVLSALLPWFFFVNSITEAATAIRRHVDVLSQFPMSKAIIPLAITSANFVNFLFGLAVLGPVFVFMTPAIAKFLWLLPVILCLHFIFTLGVSFMMSVACVYVKDLTQMLNVGIMFLFWVTPIFYPLDMIPHGYRWLLVANPASSYVVLYRSLLYDCSAGASNMWLLASGFAIVSIVAGYALFVNNESEIVKRI